MLAKACSGKCKGGGCGSAPKVWVLAACEGVIALFQKQADGHLSPLSDGHGWLGAEGVRDRLVEASQSSAFSQLVLVGSASDIAWTQASLPASVSQHIVAEIEYPLLSGWFKAPSHISRLTQALEHVFED